MPTTEEEQVKAISNGNANSANENAPPANAADLEALITSIHAPETPVEECCRNFCSVCELLGLLGDGKMALVQQAVDAGLISAVTSLLTKTPSDWMAESPRGPSAPWLRMVEDTRCQAVQATRGILDCGFRNEAVSQGLLETLTAIQLEEISSKLLDLTMLVVSEFLFREDLPLLGVDVATPAIRFLARALKSQNDLNFNRIGGGGFSAIFAFVNILRDQGDTNPAYKQEMMDAGIACVCIDLLRDLMEEATENLSLKASLTLCITYLVLYKEENDHCQAFLDAGIVDVSINMMRDWTEGKDNDNLWKLVASWIAHLMFRSDMDEVPNAFFEAGMEEFVPRLLQDDHEIGQVNGCKIFVSLPYDKVAMLPYLEDDTPIQRVFEIASSPDSDDELRYLTISVLALFCLAKSDEMAQKMIFKGYHRPIVDAVERAEKDNSSITEPWKDALDRVQELISVQSRIGNLVESIAKSRMM